MKIYFSFLLTFLVFSLNSQIDLGNKKAPTKRAVLFGISDFKNFGTISSSNDIELLNTALQFNGFQQENIKIIDNQKSVKSDFLQILSDLEKESQLGDVLFLHISSHGINMLVEKDKMERGIVFYDAPDYGLNDSLNLIDSLKNSCLMATEFQDVMIKLRRKLGSYGQLVISLDVSHGGPNDQEYELLKKGQKVLTRGGFYIFDDGDDLASIIMISGCKMDEVSYEVDVNSKGYGILSYGLSRFFMTKSEDKSFKTLSDSLKSYIRKFNLPQTPGVFGSINEKVFAFKKNDVSDPKKILTEDIRNKITGDVYVLSIGINDNTNFSQHLNYNNAENDALLFEKIIKNDFESYNANDFKFYSTTLIGTNATKKRILETINNLITNVQSNDYFFLNFSGLSFEGKGETEIYFSPYLSDDISPFKDSLGILPIETSDSIFLSLSALRDLMEFIAADKQFFLSEAGHSSNFRKILSNSIIHNSKRIASIASRKRVVLCPRGVGRDNIFCQGQKIENAPFITYLKMAVSDTKNSLFDFFEPVNRSQIEFEIMKKEHFCESKYPYCTFFYEDEFLNDHLSVKRESKSGFRGEILVDSEDLNNYELDAIDKYALIVGINDYSAGSPEWESLDNPIIDASAIYKILSKQYGYRCTLLKDATADAFLANLASYKDSMSKNDQFILYVAGHGLYDPDFFHDGFLVFSNSKPKRKDVNRRTYIPFAQIQNIMDNLPNQHVLMLIDVCYGGKFTIQESKYRGQEIYENLNGNEYISEKLNLKSRIILTSGSLNVVPDGFDGKFSPFAKRLMGVLYGGGGDKGFLTSTDLYQSLNMLPSKPMKGSFPSSHPGAEFILQKVKN